MARSDAGQAARTVREDKGRRVAALVMATRKVREEQRKKDNIA